MKILLAVMALMVGTIGGWVVGLVVYGFVAVSLFRHPVSSADIEAMGFWLAAATAVTVPFAHLPIIGRLANGVARPSTRAWRALVIGMVLGPVPAALLALLWSGGRFSSVFTPECALAAVWAAFMGAGLAVPAAWFADAWERG